MVTTNLEKNIFFKKIKIENINYNYLNWFKDPHVKKYIDYKPKSLDDLKINVEKTLKSKNVVFFGIFYKSKHIGNLKIHNISKIKSSCFFGILVGNKNFRNLGIGGIAIDYLKSWSSENDIENIFLGVDKNNHIAIKLYKNKNFKVYKILKKKIIFHLSNKNKKIVLGAAQLSSDYGVTNNKKLSHLENIKLLKYCKKIGVAEIDCAEKYRFNLIKYSKYLKNLEVNTKISTADFKNQFQLFKIIKRYNQNNIKINILYIHDGDNFLTQKGQIMLKFLFLLKKKNLIKKIGISIYNFEILKKIKKNQIDVIQVPYNIIDNRIDDYKKYLKKINCLVYIRSIFLQGSLLKKVKHNNILNDIYNKFNKLCKKKNISKISACLSHAHSNYIVDKIVIGFNSEKQMKKIINSNYKKKKFKLYLKRSQYIYAINPSLW